MGATVVDIKDVYPKQVRSVLELVVPARNGALTQAEGKDIERVHKTKAVNSKHISGPYKMHQLPVWKRIFCNFNVLSKYLHAKKY